MRLSATRSLFERRDVIIVASVSVHLRPRLARGLLRHDAAARARPADRPRARSCASWSKSSTSATTTSSRRGTFRVRGDIIEVYPSYEDQALRIELFGDEVDELITFDPLTGKTLRRHDKIAIYPKTHFVTPASARRRRSETIKAELNWCRTRARGRGQGPRGAAAAPADDVRPGDDPGDRLLPRHRELLAAPHRARSRASRRRRCSTTCRADALMIIDESHQTVPQIRGMYHGDRSRKEVLVAYGFRLPSALDNRPLNFEEWEQRVTQRLFVSATPGPYELRKSGGRGGRADHPADRAGRPADRGPAGQGAGRRPAGRDPRRAPAAASGCW